MHNENVNALNYQNSSYDEHFTMGGHQQTEMEREMNQILQSGNGESFLNYDFTNGHNPASHG